jgi:hypothetical protein
LSRIRKLLLAVTLALAAVVPVSVGTAAADHDGSVCNVWAIYAEQYSASIVRSASSFDYCSGVIAKTSCVDDGNFTVGGWSSPAASSHAGVTYRTWWSYCGSAPGSTSYFGTTTRYFDPVQPELGYWCINYTVLYGWGSWQYSGLNPCG